ncbi:uncharacterized protein LOC109833158 [Asparagus officinalis]|uniref:uncharacterized protein LOC109833158 n=1 Tax=Asparagus officinalis TaxID=4686 RepID=UPI00098DF70B|nr:uncharacterized protein LOC109833158 [Asparagus officinalis]
MNNDQKLAFWINLYNSLIMHAYLAYGVPRNGIKFFALMQKVSYTIRGQSFSPADIEFVILKMKPPPHRPQIEIIKELMERLPHMKELMDMYCGPDRVTAKQQMQELDRVAKTLPENIPSSVKRFTDRAVLSLQVFFFFQHSLVYCKSYNVSFSEMENTEYDKLEYLNRPLSVDLEMEMNVIILQLEQIPCLS